MTSIFTSINEVTTELASSCALSIPKRIPTFRNHALLVGCNTCSSQSHIKAEQIDWLSIWQW